MFALLVWRSRPMCNVILLQTHAGELLRVIECLQQNVFQHVAGC